MRLLVCGGRDFSDRLLVYEILDCLLLTNPSLVIIQGDASGADRLSKDWAISRRVPHMDYPANWKLHGRAAGPIRNSEMLNRSKPNLGLAFKGGSGTSDMVAKLLAAGIDVIADECLIRSDK